MGEDILIVFLKPPRAGLAKTRLVPEVGAEAAALLYRVLAEEAVRRTAPRPGDYRRLFFHTPAEARAEMEGWFPREEFVPQEGHDLGDRMSAAFAEAFKRGGRRVAIIGTDAPRVSRETILDALDSFGDHDVALGPAHDGGYYLMALDRLRPALFRGIAWSTPGVFGATMVSAQQNGLRVRVLQALRDVDTLEDVRSEWAGLAPLLSAHPGLVEAFSSALFKGGPRGHS